MGLRIRTKTRKARELQSKLDEIAAVNMRLGQELTLARGDRARGYESDYLVKDGIVRPRIDPRKLIVLPEQIWMVGTAIDKRVMESTREGDDIVPDFAWKCAQCDTEYDSKPETGVCATSGCGSEAFVEPKREMREIARRFFENVNPEKSWKDLTKSSIHYNICIDDVYFEAVRDKVGRIVQLWALPSERIRPAVDKETHKELGNGEYFCKVCYDAKTDPHYGKDTATCPSCSAELFETAYVELADGDDVIGRWARDEVLHYNSRALGLALVGRSRLVRIWTIAQITNWWEKYQWSTFSTNKSPDTLTAFPEMSQAQVNKMIMDVAELKAKNPSARRHAFLGVKEPPVHVKVMDSLAELQAVQSQEYLREAIAISLGVSLQSLGVQTPGKLGKETEVVEVSYNSIEEDQAQFEEFVNGQIFPEIGVSEWHYEMNSPKRDDLRRKAEIRSINANTLIALKNAGADVTITDDEQLNFKVRELVARQTPQQGVPLKPPSVAEDDLPTEQRVRDETQTPTQSTDEQSAAVASSDLRATVGGSQAIATLQTAYYNGTLPREAAMANARLVFGFTEQEASELFPEVAAQPATSPSAASAEERNAAASPPLTQGEARKRAALGTFSKGLSSRNISGEAAISGIRAVENDFVRELTSRYERAIDDLIHEAETKHYSEGRIKARLDELVQRFQNEVAAHVEAKFAKQAYLAAFDEESANFDDAAFTQKDQAALDLITSRGDGLIPTLKDFGDETRKVFFEIISNAYAQPEQFDLDKMVSQMRDAVGGETYKLERIARTETTRISNTARATQWQKYASATDKYEWCIAEGDERTCEICKEIADGNPYELSDLEAVTNGYVPHPNCRCTAIRKIEVQNE